MSFSVSVDFSYGRCTLRLSSGTAGCVLTAHTVMNSFNDLVIAIADFAEGRRCVSFRWTGENEDGSFVDMVLDPAGGVGIAVQRFVSSGPLRGEAQFVAHAPYDEVITTFAAALWRTRVRYADEHGFIEQWGWLLPQHHINTIMTRAGLIGFSPANLRYTP